MEQIEDLVVRAGMPVLEVIGYIFDSYGSSAQLVVQLGRDRSIRLDDGGFGIEHSHHAGFLELFGLLAKFLDALIER